MSNAERHWTFLSNHAHVLGCIARDADIPMSQIAAKVGITLRAVQRIVAELEQAGVLSHRREGRRNHYRINGRKSLRHPLESHHTVDDLMHAVML